MFIGEINAVSGNILYLFIQPNEQVQEKIIFS